MFAEISCGIPPSTNNISPPNVSLLYQDTYNYTCLTGYTTTGNVDTECLANGSFSLVDLPECSSK